MAPRRQILVCLALATGAFLLLGCGADETEEPSVSSVAAGEISAKLDQIQERILDEDCDGGAEALATLMADVPDVDANQKFRDDLTTLLTDLEEQVASECAAEAGTTSSSSTTSTSTEDEDTTTDSVETTTTETDTTEDTTESTTDPEEEPEVPDEPVTPPEAPPTGGSDGGSGVPPVDPGGESGGVGPGFEVERTGRAAQR